jgi:hypothetical protein
MEINQFEREIRNALGRLSYVQSLTLIRTKQYILDGRAELEKEYCINIYFNSLTFKLNFSLLAEKKKRIWGIDRDNLLGWHLHPLYETELHQSIPEKSIDEIVSIF